MKLSPVILLLVAVACASAQWISSFSPRRYPEQPAAAPASGDNVGNRFGGTGNNTGAVSSSSNNTESTAAQNPDTVDRFGFNIHQVNEVQNYPEEKIPYWFRNRQHIAQHIGRVQPATSSSANRTTRN